MISQTNLLPISTYAYVEFSQNQPSGLRENVYDVFKNTSTYWIHTDPLLNATY